MSDHSYAHHVVNTYKGNLNQEEHKCDNEFQVIVGIDKSQFPKAKDLDSFFHHVILSSIIRKNSIKSFHALSENKQIILEIDCEGFKSVNEIKETLKSHPAIESVSVNFRIPDENDINQERKNPLRSLAASASNWNKPFWSGLDFGIFGNTAGKVRQVYSTMGIIGAQRYVSSKGFKKNMTAVGVVDDSVDGNISVRFWRNTKELKNGQDSDGNGCIDDITGCNFQSARPDGSLYDGNSHGTSVAIDFARVAGSGYYGPVGINPAITVVRLQLGRYKSLTAIARSFDYTMKSDIKITINAYASLTGRGNRSAVVDEFRIQGKIMSELAEKGHMYFGSMGNFRRNIDQTNDLVFPCGARVPDSTLCVSGSDLSGNKASAITWGPRSVDIGVVAVGYTNWPVASYTPGKAAGLAALILSQHPILHGRDVMRSIRTGNSPRFRGAWTQYTRYGFIDYSAAIIVSYTLATTAKSRYAAQKEKIAQGASRIEAIRSSFGNEDLENIEDIEFGDTWDKWKEWGEDSGAEVNLFDDTDDTQRPEATNKDKPSNKSESKANLGIIIPAVVAGILLISAIALGMLIIKRQKAASRVKMQIMATYKAQSKLQSSNRSGTSNASNRSRSSSASRGSVRSNTSRGSEKSNASSASRKTTESQSRRSSKASKA